MKLLSPVGSLESAELQINAGANEIYVGLRSPVYNVYSFSGRGQKNKDDTFIVPDDNELKEIVKLSHDRNVEVSLAANTPFFSTSKSGYIEKEYLKYINTGIQSGIDNIIIGDIGLLYELGKMNLPVNLHASTYFDTMNIQQLKFLKQLGATRAVLTYQIGIDEIELLCKEKIMEIEIFGYMGCSFFNGACNLVHNMGEEKSPEGRQLGIPCKGMYKVWSDEISERVIPFLDAELGCALCSVSKLRSLGVDVIKIAGRDRNQKMMAEITSIFRQALDFNIDLGEEKYKKEIRMLKPSWWEKIWCCKNGCKYTENLITRSYTGYYLE